MAISNCSTPARWDFVVWCHRYTLKRKRKEPTLVLVSGTLCLEPTPQIGLQGVEIHINNKRNN